MISENKTLNRGEIVYFGTKLLIKTQDLQFLSMVQFVAIYTLFGGTKQTKNLWWGDRICFIGLGTIDRAHTQLFILIEVGELSNKCTLH